jgi:hypothetical protein
VARLAITPNIYSLQAGERAPKCDKMGHICAFPYGPVERFNQLKNIEISSSQESTRREYCELRESSKSRPLAPVCFGPPYSPSRARLGLLMLAQHLGALTATVRVKRRLPWLLSGWQCRAGL